jgi:diguanylate cyclase (GGDEF)-like protein
MNTPTAKRIYLVEDSLPVQRFVRESVEKIPGIEVIGASVSEEEAVNGILAHAPDLLVLDITLSPGSGLNVLRRVREAGCAARALMLSNHVSKEYRAACRAAGAEDFFDKSQEFQRLLTTLASWAGVQPTVEPGDAGALAACNLEPGLYDDITGLPNRAALLDHLRQAIQEAIRTNTHLALLFIDLDHFKVISQAFGHHIGDALLRNVAERLRHNLPDPDSVSHLGGDIFACLLRDMGDANALRTVADRVMEALAPAIMLKDLSFKVSASIGAALYPQHGTSAEELMRHGEQALCGAKAEGRHAYRLFDADMEQRTAYLRGMHARLGTALGAGQFLLHYQPWIEIEGGRIAAVEALLRWQHPEHGLLGPEHIIGQAEQMGLIAELGRHVLDTALAQLRAWDTTDMGVPRVAVNTSALELRPGWVAFIHECLKRHAIAPERLVIEISENDLSLGNSRFEGWLQELRALGVGLALDNFGAGYSCLATLKNLPLTHIKLDRSLMQDFTRDRKSYAIVHAVSEMARGIGVPLVAKGVQTPQQRQLLRLNCQYIQGYHIAQPMPAAIFVDWMQQHRARIQEPQQM